MGAASSFLQESDQPWFSSMMSNPSMLLLLFSVVSGQQLMEPRKFEPEERLAFANYTSSLFGAFPITSSSSYSTFALAVAGVGAGLLFAYALLTDSLSALLSSSASRSSFDILTSVVLPALQRD